MTTRKLPVRFTGQHFTIDRSLISSAIKFANLNFSDTVVDIGAGKGFITIHLLKHAREVIAIEKDFQLMLHLRRKVGKQPNLVIAHADILTFKLPEKPFKVASNIPYGITSQILQSLMFDNLEHFDGGSLILPLAVARKLVSVEIFNPYIVFYRTFFHLKVEREVSPSSFIPPPTVMSALVSIARVEHTIIEKDKYIRFIILLLHDPGTNTRSAFRKIFRKSQVRGLFHRLKIDLDLSIAALAPAKFRACFEEMLKTVPGRCHP